VICEHTQSSLIGFQFNTLSPGGRHDVEAHLLECRACLKEFLDIKRAIEEPDDALMPSLDSRARLRSAVIDEVREVREEDEPSPPLSWWKRPLALGLAAVSVTLALNAVHGISRSSGAMPRTLAEREIPSMANIVSEPEVISTNAITH
jgi:anti-sigma factor RsiW